MLKLPSVPAALAGPDGRLAATYLLVAGLAVAVHRALPTGSLQQNLLYDVVGFSAVAAILYGIHRHRPARALPWLLIAASQLLFVTGDTLWTILELMGQSPFPSIADVAYLLGYPVLVIAFTAAIRLRVRGGDQSGLLDGSILSAAAGLVGWVVLVRPVLDAADDPISLIVTAAYPLGDLMVLGVAIGLLATPGARTPSFVMLISSIVLLFVADTAYAFQVASGTYVDGGILDSLWLASYVAISAAALHGSMRDVAAPHPVSVAWLSRLRLSLLAIAMLTGPLLILVVNFRWESDVPILALGSAFLSVLVLVRLATVVRALARDNAARVKLEGELSYRASHDPLTGLPNRRRFIERLEGVLSLPDRRPLSVLFLDLDDFKTVNDSLGHAAGDALLVSVATRLQRLLRADDLAARLGGDEFGIILDGKEAAAAGRVAERLLAALDEPVDVDGRQVTARASIGIVDASAPGVTTAQLLASADIAMYEAKDDGKGRARTYVQGTRSAVQDRMELEGDLRGVVARGELRIEYQPIMELATGRTFGLEALVRWQHPTRGRLEPDAFVPLAERAGLIGEIDRWVLAEACHRLAAWRAVSPDVMLSVNVSALGLVDPGLVPDLVRATGAAGVPPSAIALEVTESAILADSDVVRDNLVALRATGARVAIDDFGTGYSSLSYLSRLSADILKIDRSFVEDLDRAQDRGLAAVVVRLGETLGMLTIAEGVTRPSQLDAVRGLGCQLAQGYLFAGALAPAAVTAWLTAERGAEREEREVRGGRAADRGVKRPRTQPA
ncbi:MAG TPA: EAL domain-containing protein [Candidatus Limnocylindrales bacterium]|nr:EAL domain-containing protein [Candidatus Limnocylindrales bacterium]